ncbi:MAG: orotidine-5'-phosphate decarboxylase [Salinirussus sp.]
MGFFADLRRRIQAVNSVLCVGLDPHPDRLPGVVRGEDMPRWAFNRRIIDATHEHVAAYKPNAAFYEDPEGWRALTETVAYAHGKDVPVVLDAKRGDVGSTARQYARLLDDVDAITVNPYLGRDSVEPFLTRDGKGVFVLCRTSNPGGADLQDLELSSGESVYERVAALADVWNANGNVGLVVGATVPEELEGVREAVPDLPFLVPGIGAQGGDAEAAVKYGLVDGVGLVNAARSVIFAGEDAVGVTGSDVDADVADRYFAAAGEAAKRLSQQLEQAR